MFLEFYLYRADVGVLYIVNQQKADTLQLHHWESIFLLLPAIITTTPSLSHQGYHEGKIDLDATSCPYRKN